MTEQEKQRFLEYWNARRAGGKTRFILRDTLSIFALILVTNMLFDLFDHSFMEALAASLTAQSILFKTVVGVVVAFCQWHGQEALYRKIAS